MLSTGTILDIGDHTVEILDTPEDTGDRYRVRIVAEPGAPGIDGDFPQIHPILIETFWCISGEMTVRVGTTLSVLPPGEKAEVPRGNVHGFVNTGQDDPSCRRLRGHLPGWVQQGGRPAPLRAIYDQLKREVPVTKKGEPPILQMAVLTHANRQVIGAPGVAGALMPALTAVGRLRGYRSEFPDFGI